MFKGDARNACTLNTALSLYDHSEESTYDRYARCPHGVTMKLRCRVGLHYWQGCACRDCAMPKKATSDAASKLDHEWVHPSSCLCRRCGYKKPLGRGLHWFEDGCTCIYCKQAQDADENRAGHDWQPDGICVSCSQTIPQFKRPILDALLNLQPSEPSSAPLAGKPRHYDGLKDRLGKAVELAAGELKWMVGHETDMADLLQSTKTAKKKMDGLDLEVSMTSFSIKYERSRSTVELNISRNTDQRTFTVYLREDEWD